MKTTNNPYKIEHVSDFGMAYYQVVRKRDEAILYANSNIDNIASFILDEGIDVAGDPTQDSRRLYYFIGLTTLSKYDVTTELKSLLKSFSDYCYRQGNEIYRLENELENPPYNG